MILSENPRIGFINCDCMDVLRGLPDDAYELAIVDPPYGIGISSNPIRQQYAKKEWDFKAPEYEYFEALKRCSENQIIWGGNYFLDYLGATQGFIVWDKVQPHEFSLAMCEMAWMSIQKPAKIWKCSVLAEKRKIHPTQKPVQLYEWLLTNYAKPGDTILDTHGGSFSSAIACWNLGFDFVGIEKDKDYFDAAVERFQNHIKQPHMFDMPLEQKVEQGELI